MENFTAWTDDSKDGIKVKMMHLRYGVSIPYNAWKEARDQKTASLFVRKISKAIWGCHTLMNRAVELQKINKERLVHRSPRKPLTPKKKAVLEKCYIHYLQLHNQLPQNISFEERKVLSKKWRRYLSVYINYLITSELEKLKETKKEEAEGQDSTSNSSS
ncbi:uncharacterized protein [Temnothorax longispinosus]|uniref:uncharacterized protein isoform X4 n=1 Tax=Temnothorax longispinosus TaxID=300112 RepID=UPI003A9A135E